MKIAVADAVMSDIPWQRRHARFNGVHALQDVSGDSVLHTRLERREIVRFAPHMNWKPFSRSSVLT